MFIVFISIVHDIGPQLCVKGPQLTCDATATNLGIIHITYWFLFAFFTVNFF